VEKFVDNRIGLLVAVIYAANDFIAARLTVDANQSCLKNDELRNETLFSSWMDTTSWGLVIYSELREYLILLHVGV
jgi:hypothetical protein